MLTGFPVVSVATQGALASPRRRRGSGVEGGQNLLGNNLADTVDFQELRRRGELQSVALEDIASRLEALQQLIRDAASDGSDLDVAKAHQLLRDLVGVFHDLVENAQSFMAGVARSLELQQADIYAVKAYKRRLIEYLDRFLGDLIRRSDSIAKLISDLSPEVDSIFSAVAEREARDASPDASQDQTDRKAQQWQVWRERWKGLCGWFLTTGHESSQSELLRASARSAIPRLLSAIAAMNERRSGRSDRSADFRILAQWFAECTSDSNAHRLARAAFALHPARHYACNTEADSDMPTNTPWADAPPLRVNPRLIKYGELAPRRPLAGVRDRGKERALVASNVAEESRQVEAARKRLVTGRPTKLSELGELDLCAFGLFLNILGEALAAQANPEQTVERQTGDGLFLIRMEPLGAATEARIVTPAGIFSGRDHLLTIRLTWEPTS